MTLFGLPEFQVSAGVLIALIVVLILTGRLVPRRQMEDLREDRDARLAAAERQVETWQAAYAAAVESRKAAQEQVTQLMETGRAAQDIMNALPVRPTANARILEAHSDATDQA